MYYRFQVFLKTFLGIFSTVKENRFLIMVAVITSLAGLLFGLDLGYVNGALELIKEDLHLSLVQSERVTSVLMAGAAIGAIFSGFFSTRYGRKNTMLIAGMFYALFLIIIMMTESYKVLLFSRFFIGFAVGISSFIAPLYLSEVAPSKIRGAMIACYQLMITIGILLMFISNYLLAPYHSWHLMLITVLVPAVIMFFGCFYLPQSPRWLIMKGRVEEARYNLGRLHVQVSPESIDEKLQVISNSISYNKKNGLSSIFYNAWLWKVILLGVCLQILQQFSGMNAFLFYSSDIFHAAGFGNNSFNTVIVGIVNVLTTVIAIVLVDRVGRKPILYVGLFLLVISLFTIGHLFGMQKNGVDLTLMERNLLFVSSLVFIFSFAISLGPIIWIICAEICPLQYRDIGITFSTATNWIANMLVGRYTLSLFHNWGYDHTFYFFSISCLLGIVFVRFFTPETKSISLELMENNLKRHKPLRHIGHYTALSDK